MTPLSHLAIIMDGNGRWAQQQGLPRSLGHRAGMETLRQIVRLCPENGIHYLSVYALSTENWKRPAWEIQSLMMLMGEYLDLELNQLIQEGIKLRVHGDLTPFSPELQGKIKHAVESTADLKQMVFSIALNYGGRDEILRSAKAMARRALNGEDPALWTEEDLAAELYTKDLPDPDLLIRTGGDMRVSNFMLWQIAYTELWCTDTYWPDFNEELLQEAIRTYEGRQRRFGGI